MKGKLVKIEDGYELLTQGFLKGSTNHKLIDSLNVEEGNIRYKLSLKNCQAIERGYDLDKIFQREIDELMFTGNLDDPSEYRSGMYKGAKILLELMGDKKFSEEDVNGFIDYVIREKHKQEGVGTGLSNKELTSANIGVYRVFQEKDIRQIYWKEYIQSLHQTEWDVKIEMDEEKEFIFDPAMGISQGHYLDKPKLDENNCLILKRIWKEN